jgi:predicted Zn-dependent protease with MMP-like domain
VDATTVGLDEFAVLVEDALTDMPEWVQAAVAGIAIIVDDAPPPDWQGRGLLLGRFHGIAHTRTGSRVPGSLPDRIELYRLPILTVCHDREELVDRVRKILGHEIGHALGLGEARLRELGWH